MKMQILEKLYFFKFELIPLNKTVPNKNYCNQKITKTLQFQPRNQYAI